MPELLKTTVNNDGFEGIIYPGDNSKDKVLIVVSGSNGGMKMTAEIAQFYNGMGLKYDPEDANDYYDKFDAEDIL